MSTELDLPSREYAKDDCPADAASSPSYKVLGIRVDAVQIPDVIAKVEGWIAERGPSRFIAVIWLCRTACPWFGSDAGTALV